MPDYPKKLSENERDILFSVLPESKQGYKLYRQKINYLVVIGSGRFDRANKILGKPESVPDLNVPSTPVFASGTITCKETVIDVVIHEMIDDEIEFDIATTTQFDLRENFEVISKWSYSDWNPGDKAPNDNSIVREVIVAPGKYVLALAPAHKKIWMHNISTGVNHLIPVSNFYNQLMMVKDERKSDIALNPGLFFKTLESYTDRELISAFITYNKYLSRFEIDLSYFKEAKSKIKKKNIFSFLHRGTN